MHDTLKRFSVYTMRERKTCAITNCSKELLKGTRKENEWQCLWSFPPFFCIHSHQVMKKIEVKGAYFRSSWERNIQIWMKSSYKLFQMNMNKDISLYKATLWQNLYKALTGNRSTASTSSQIHLYVRVTYSMYASFISRAAYDKNVFTKTNQS